MTRAGPDRDAAHELHLVAKPLLLERRPHACADQHPVVRLRSVVLGALFDAADHARRVVEARHNDDGNVARGLAGLEPLEQLEAIAHRHLDVAEYEVDVRRRHSGEGFAAVRRGDDGVAKALEHLCQQLARAMGVVNHENTRLRWLGHRGRHAERRRGAHGYRPVARRRWQCINRVRVRGLRTMKPEGLIADRSRVREQHLVLEARGHASQQACHGAHEALLRFAQRVAPVIPAQSGRRGAGPCRAVRTVDSSTIPSAMALSSCAATNAPASAVCARRDCRRAESARRNSQSAAMRRAVTRTRWSARTRSRRLTTDSMTTPMT